MTDHTRASGAVDSSMRIAGFLGYASVAATLCTNMLCTLWIGILLWQTSPQYPALLAGVILCGIALTIDILIVLTWIKGK